MCSQKPAVEHLRLIAEKALLCIVLRQLGTPKQLEPKLEYNHFRKVWEVEWKPEVDPYS